MFSKLTLVKTIFISILALATVLILPTTTQVLAADCSYQLSTNQTSSGLVTITVTGQSNTFYTIFINPGDNEKVFRTNIGESSHSERIDVDRYYSNPPPQITITAGEGITSQGPDPCTAQGSNVVSVSAPPPDTSTNSDGGNGNQSDTGSDSDSGSGDSTSDEESGGVNIGTEFKIAGQPISEVFPDFGTLFTRVITFALAAAGLVFFAMLLWGGFRYMLAQGDDKAIMEARQTLTNAFIGLLIVIASFAIITLIALATGASIAIF